MALRDDEKVQSPAESVTRVAAPLNPGLELEGLERTLSQLPKFAAEASDRPDLFWQRQAAAIRSRIAVEEASKRPLTGFVWAAALSLALLLGMLLSLRSAPVRSVAQTDPDHDLLVAVEHAVNNEGPEALEPAALLADEIGLGDKSISAARTSFKEKKNAN